VDRDCTPDRVGHHSIGLWIKRRRPSHPESFRGTFGTFGTFVSFVFAAQAAFVVHGFSPANVLTTTRSPSVSTVISPSRSVR
jgi:hypothetical protein